MSFKRGGNKNGNNIHIALYREHKDRQERQEKLEKEALGKSCSFQPNLEKSKNFKSARVTGKNFIERNQEYIQEKKNKRHQRE